MGITGTARLGRRTKTLIPTLLPGDIAVIDHRDIDRVCAEGLAKAGVRAVVNAQPSISGAFPNDAPRLIIEAGIPLIDNVGEEVFELLKEGDIITIDGSEVVRKGETVASGVLLTQGILRAEMDAAGANMGDNLEKFVQYTAEYLMRDKDKIISNPRVPDVKTRLEGKQALVVVRGPDYLADLAALRSYISEMKPVIIAVDGGADAVIEAGYKPSIIVGDMDSVSDSALLCGAEVIPHAYEDGWCPSAERLERLGIESTPWALSATSEDLALLLAWEKGAELIVAVGTHSNLIEYMEKDRKGMASTFLVRLRVGTKLVDAKGVSKLYRPAPPVRHVWGVVGAALVAILAAVLISDPLRNALVMMWLNLRANLGF